MKYEYAIKKVSDDDRYGNCERCGKRCIPHYAQAKRKIGALSSGWELSGFGHKECLNNFSWKDAKIIED